MPNGQSNKAVEEVKRELERRSQDTILVFNPTKEPRKVIWNRFVHLVKASQEAVLPRYIAEKYVREMVDFLILDKNAGRVKVENERRVRAGMKVMDAQEREVFDWRTDNAELRKQFLPMVYKGVVEEYGKYTETTPQMLQSQNVTSDQDIISEIDRENELRSDQKTAEEAKETGIDPVVEERKQEAIRKVAA